MTIVLIRTSLSTEVFMIIENQPIVSSDTVHYRTWVPVFVC